MTVLLEDEILVSYRGWILKVASHMSSDAGEVEDLAQEAWVAMWRALKTYRAERGSLPSWLTQAALWRMREVVVSKSWTGRPARHQGRTPVKGIAEYPTELEVLESALSGQEMLESVELAYHHGEISDVIAALPSAQRRYVRLRFWQGARKPELTAAYGYDPSALWRRAKPVLQEKLEYLSDVV